jgi:hypothetical protein
MSRRILTAVTALALLFGSLAVLAVSGSATAGCYGVLVVPSTAHSGTYQAIEGGRPHPAPAAGLLLAMGNPGEHGQQKDN